MSRVPWLRACAALMLALPLTGCGIRLPVSQPGAMQRVEVHLDAPARTRDPDVMIWLVADSYHTGLVFPYDWLMESGFAPPADFPAPRHVMMSWGNRDAYSPEGLDKPWKILRVLFTPTPSVMELIPIDWDVAEVLPGQRIWRGLVPRDRGPALASFLNGCGVSGPDGRPVVVRKSSWGDGVQLESRHAYFIPRVCNIWTVQALETLGGEFNPWRSTTANGLIRQAERPPNGFELIWPGTEKDDAR
jgi:hypothetical protein